MRLTTTQIIEELEAVLRDRGPEDAYTTAELGEMWGLAAAAVRHRLKLLKKAGKLEAVAVRREGIDGVMQTTRGYRILLDR